MVAQVRISTRCPRCETNLVGEWDADARCYVKSCLACGWHEPARMARTPAGAEAPATGPATIAEVEEDEEEGEPAEPESEPIPEPAAAPELAPVPESAPATEAAPDALMTANQIAAEFDIRAKSVYNAGLLGQLRVASKGQNKVRYARADVLAWRALATDMTDSRKRSALVKHAAWKLKQAPVPAVADPLVSVLAEYRKVKADLLATEGEVRVFEGRLADARYLAGLLGEQVGALKGKILEGLGE